MTTPTLYTGKQMLLDYYNKQKNTQLTLDDVVFGTPQRREEDGALTNSWVRIYPAKGSGLTGAPKIYYDRVHMSYVGNIVVEKGTAIRTHDLLNKINEKYNTVFSEDDVENEILDPVAVGEIFISLKIKEESVTYYDGDIIYTNRYPDPADLPQPEIEKMATWSIVDSSINAVVTNAELTAEVNRSNMVVATLPLSAPKTYFEVNVETNGAIIGLARKDAAKTNASGVVIGGDNLSWGLNTSTGIFTHNGQTLTYCPPVPLGSTVGVLIDLTNGVLSYQVGSVMYGVAAIGLEQFSDLLPAACGTSASTQSKFTANFGQVPMTNTPPYDFRRGVYTVKQTMPNTGTGGYDVPDAGTLFDTYCKGQDLWGALADGEGGVVTTLLQAGSFTCGAAANVVANLSVNPAELEIAKGTLAETTFTLSRGLEESVNFLVSATYEGLANQSYHGALQVRIGASAVNNINGGKITIPAGDTSFIIRTMLTSGYVAQPGDIIKIKVEVEPTYAGLITNTEPVIVNIKLLNQSNLPVGTLISTYCNGFTNFGVFADGAGGTYEEVIEDNSEACGYVPFVLRTVRVNGTGTFALPLGVDSVSITGQGSEGVVSNYRLGGVPGKGNFYTIPFEYVDPAQTHYVALTSASTIDEYAYLTATSVSNLVYRTKDLVNYEKLDNVNTQPVRCGDWFITTQRVLVPGNPEKFTEDLVRTKDFITFEPCLKGKGTYVISNTRSITSKLAYPCYYEKWLIVDTAVFNVPGSTTRWQLSLDGQVFVDVKDGQNGTFDIDTRGIDLGNRTITTRDRIYFLKNSRTSQSSTFISYFDTNLNRTDITIPFPIQVAHKVTDGVIFYKLFGDSERQNPNFVQSRVHLSFTDVQTLHETDLGFGVADCIGNSKITLLASISKTASGFIGSVTKATNDGIVYTNASMWPEAVVRDTFFSIRYVSLYSSDNPVYFSANGLNWTFCGDYSSLVSPTNGVIYQCIDSCLFILGKDVKDSQKYVACKLDTVLGLYESPAASYGKYSTAKIGTTVKSFPRGIAGIKPPQTTNIFNIDPGIQSNIDYVCAGNTYMDLSFTARKVNYPVAGTIVTDSCVGYERKQIQASGNNTNITVSVDENSIDCGYNYDHLREVRLAGSGKWSPPKGTNSITVKAKGGKLKPTSYKQTNVEIPFYFEYLSEVTDNEAPYINKSSVVFNGIYYWAVPGGNGPLRTSTDSRDWSVKVFDYGLPPSATISSYNGVRAHDVAIVGNKLYVILVFNYTRPTGTDIVYNYDYTNVRIYSTTDNFTFTTIYQDEIRGLNQVVLSFVKVKDTSVGVRYVRYKDGIHRYLMTDNDFSTQTELPTYIVDYINDKKIETAFNTITYRLNGRTFMFTSYSPLRYYSTNQFVYGGLSKAVLIEWLDDWTFRILDSSNGFQAKSPASSGYITGSEIYFLNGKYIHYYKDPSGVTWVNTSTDAITWNDTLFIGHVDFTNAENKIEQPLSNGYYTVLNGKMLTTSRNNGYFYYTTDGITWFKELAPEGFRSLSWPLTQGEDSLTFINQAGKRQYIVRRASVGDTIVDEYERTGEDTTISVNSEMAVFRGSTTQVAPTIETKTIALDADKLYSLNYTVPLDGALTIEYMGVDDNVPAPGTFISTFCYGFTKTNILADGSGGQYSEIVEYNSTDCGYVPPVINYKEYVTVPTVFSSSNVSAGAAGLAPNGYVGYVTTKTMLVTEDKIGTGKYYFELDYFVNGLVVGIIDESLPTTDFVNPIYPGSTSQSWGVSSYWKHVAGVSSKYSNNWSNIVSKKVIGFFYDGQTGEACLYINGEDTGVTFVAPNNGNLRFAVGYKFLNYAGVFSINFGRNPFKFPRADFKPVFGKSYLKGTEPEIPSDGYLTPTTMDDQIPDSESYVRGEGYLVELANSSIARSKISLSGGSWVWEITALTVGDIVVGVALPDQRLVNLDTGAYVGDSPFSWGVNMFGTQKYHNGATFNTNLSAGDSITVSLRFKNPEGMLEADFGNGYETMFTGIPEGVYPAISVVDTKDITPIVYVNFGQAKFMNTVPAQYWPGLGVPTGIPPAGIYVGTACEGFNKKVIYTNGSGGTYSQIVEYNSESCGFSE